MFRNLREFIYSFIVSLCNNEIIVYTVYFVIYFFVYRIISFSNIHGFANMIEHTEDGIWALKDDTAHLKDKDPLCIRK